MKPSHIAMYYARTRMREAHKRRGCVAATAVLSSLTLVTMTAHAQPSTTHADDGTPGDASNDMIVPFGRASGLLGEGYSSLSMSTKNRCIARAAPSAPSGESYSRLAFSSGWDSAQSTRFDLFNGSLNVNYKSFRLRSKAALESGQHVANNSMSASFLFLASPPDTVLDFDERDFRRYYVGGTRLKYSTSGRPRIDKSNQISFMKGCGDSFVKRGRRGASLRINIRVVFDSFAAYKKHRGELRIGTSVFDAAADIEKLSSEARQRSSVVLDAEQRGGAVANLSALLGQDGTTTCSLATDKAREDCVKLVRAVATYAASAFARTDEPCAPGTPCRLTDSAEYVALGFWAAPWSEYVDGMPSSTDISRLAQAQRSVNGLLLDRQVDLLRVDEILQRKSDEGKALQANAKTWAALADLRKDYADSEARLLAVAAICFPEDGNVATVASRCSTAVGKYQERAISRARDALLRLLPDAESIGGSSCTLTDGNHCLRCEHSSRTNVDYESGLLRTGRTPVSPSDPDYADLAIECRNLPNGSLSAFVRGSLAPNNIPIRAGCGGCGNGTIGCLSDPNVYSMHLYSQAVKTMGPTQVATPIVITSPPKQYVGNGCLPIPFGMAQPYTVKAGETLSFQVDWYNDWVCCGTTGVYLTHMFFVVEANDALSKLGISTAIVASQ